MNGKKLSYQYMALDDPEEEEPKTNESYPTLSWITGAVKPGPDGEPDIELEDFSFWSSAIYAKMEDGTFTVGVASITSEERPLIATAGGEELFFITGDGNS